MRTARIASIPMFLIASLCASLISTDLYASAELTADAILDTLTETMNPEQSPGEMALTIVISSGDERTFIYETYSKGQGEKSLMKYLKPSRVKGQTILMLNDANDIWTYFPRTREVRKLATHAKKQKLEGSDFSYEDMGGGDAFIEEYEAGRRDDAKKEGRDCFTLELTRKENSDASYSRVMLWVDKESFVPLVIDYYHERDPDLLEKELVCSDR